MNSRGFSMTKENPDVYVILQLNVDMEALAVVKRNTAPNKLRVETVPKGAIIVTLVDAKSNLSFWYDYAEGKIKNKEPEAGKKRLDYAITQIFKTLK